MDVARIIAEPITAATPRRIGFWRRQLALNPTSKQIIFDVLFGVIAPVLCFVFDPIVFRDGFGGAPLLSDYQTFAYLFSGLQIMLLCLWLIIGPGAQFWNHAMGGVLLVGGVFCLALGVVLAPFSLIGLMFGIGIFGFTPLITAFVYLRNSSRALRATGPHDPVVTQVLTAGLAMLLVSGLPLLLSIQIHTAVNTAIDEIVRGDSQKAIFAAHRLTPLRFFAHADLDRIVNAYSSESDQKRRELLKSCYREITGEDIEQRAVRLND